MSVKHPELQIPRREDIENTSAYTQFCDSQNELLRIWENQCNKVFKESSEKLINELKDKVFSFYTFAYQDVPRQPNIRKDLMPSCSNPRAFSTRYTIYTWSTELGWLIWWSLKRISQDGTTTRKSKDTCLRFGDIQLSIKNTFAE